MSSWEVWELWELIGTWGKWGGVEGIWIKKTASPPLAVFLFIRVWVDHPPGVLRPGVG